MNILNNKQNKIKLAKVISPNLIFRNSVDELFNYINNSKTSKIIIDFKRIKSITRSFAQQYLINKEKSKSKKEIIDLNIPPNIKYMFELIRKENRI